ncbi:MAG: MBL fold metallo-hydrolase, partial [Gammaproteobacteria bacterium]
MLHRQNYSSHMDRRRDKHSFQVLPINEAFGAVDLNVMIVRHVEGITTCTAIGVDTTIKPSKQLLAAEASRVYCHVNRIPDGWSMVRTYLILISAVGLGLSLIISSDAAHALTLRWFGHAFFVVTSSDGVRVAMDPFGDIGYSVPEVAANVVTVSHEHGDHNVAERLAGPTAILRGLKPGGADWNPISYDLRDVRITALPAYHDSAEGRKLGLNAIFIVETGGLRLAHLSDIGHTLSEATLEAMGRIDILLVPVGGR